MGLSDKGSNRDTARTHLTRLGMDFSHFRSRQASQLHGLQEHRKKGIIELNAILRGEHPTYTTYSLKKRLIQEGLKEHKCEECGIVDWHGKSLAIHLDHINGISDDHRLENLRMLCPNCHSQTDTYAGKNKQLWKIGGEA
ncbi:MAG: hypothetical protein CTY12_01260 [Methylotenera sp.]|nr:MAG: hypothetical protein CTY12_01260 [Methylotenera sp.]